MSTYVVGDLHGCYDEFMELVDRINQNDKDAHFILVGDIVDRGPDTIKLLRWAIENVNMPDSPFEMIMGNHEFMKIEELEYYFQKISEGHSRNIKYYDMQYEFNRVLAKEKIEKEEIRDFYEFFRNLPYYIEVDTKLLGQDKHFIIVHAAVTQECMNKDGTINGVKLLPELEVISRHAGGWSEHADIVWSRNYSGYDTMVGDSIVIHGHTPTVTNEIIEAGAVPGRIDYRPHDVNIDCGLVFHTYTEAANLHPNLAAICLETFEEIYLYEPTPYPNGYDGYALNIRRNMMGE